MTKNKVFVMFAMASSTNAKMLSRGMVVGHYHIREEWEFKCNLQLLLLLYETLNTATLCSYAYPIWLSYVFIQNICLIFFHNIALNSQKECDWWLSHKKKSKSKYICEKFDINWWCVMIWLFAVTAPYVATKDESPLFNPIPVM